MRTLIDIPAEDLERLDRLARQNRRSRAAEVREAIRAHLLTRSDTGWIGRGLGYWRDRPGPADGVLYQQEIRQDRDTD